MIKDIKLLARVILNNFILSLLTFLTHRLPVDVRLQLVKPVLVQAVKDFEVSDKVFLYDRFRFAGKPQKAVVIRVNDGHINYTGAEIRFTENTGNSKWSIGSTTLVCKEQLRHRL